ncbi:MAG: hypothetical protein U0792_14965 [Gemmataceae bacterium]
MPDSLPEVDLAAEPGQHPLLATSDLRRQHLERDEDFVAQLFRESGIACEINRAHAAPTERSENAVRTDRQPLPATPEKFPGLEMREIAALNEEIRHVPRRGGWHA